MRVLFFTPYFLPYTSGMTIFPAQLLSALTHHAQVDILTFRHDPTLLTEERRDGLTIHRLPYNFKISKGFISLPSLFYFFRYLSYDVIILNLPNAEGLPLALLARLFRRKIVTMYICQVVLSPGYLNRVINAFLNLSVNIQLAVSNLVITLTKDYANHSPQLQPIKSRLKYVLPTLHLHQPDKRLKAEFIHQKKNQVWVGFIGRIAAEKGLEHLIDALNGFKSPQQYTLILAGPQPVGETPYRHKIMNKLSRARFRVIDKGFLDDTSLTALLASLDVLVIPSVNRTEAFGLIQLQAMSVGTPVVVSDLPGLRFLVTQTGLGQIVKPADSNALSTALLKVISHRSQYVNPHKSKAMIDYTPHKAAKMIYRYLSSLS